MRISDWSSDVCSSDLRLSLWEKDAQLKELACRENRVGVYNGRPWFEPGPSPREEFAQARRGFDAQALHSVRRNYSHGTAAFNKVLAPQFDLFTRYGLHFCSNFDCVSASRHRFAVVGYRFDSLAEIGRAHV